VVLGTLLVALLTLWPLPDQRVSSPAWCIVCDADHVPNLVLNVALFLPLGVGLGLRGVPRLAALLLMALLTAGVEALQFHVVAGRDASLGDVLANLVGGALGLRLGRRLAAEPRAVPPC
jgi:VanZ family protein